MPSGAAVPGGMTPPGAMGMPGGSPMGPGVPGAPGVPGDYAIEPPKGAVDAALSNGARFLGCINGRSEEHTSELQSLMRISYAVFCLKKKKKTKQSSPTNSTHEPISF